jgi:hypothetical protein
MTPLQTFLIDRKKWLLDLERRAPRGAQGAILGQLQMSDAILQFLSTQQTEDDMAKLKLTLDKQATPIDDIKPRNENEELTEALIELADQLKPGTKFPLNNIPPEMKIKSISTKIYQLRKMKKIPFSILPKTRTIKERDEKTGQVKSKEVIYMVRVTEDVAKRLEEREKTKAAKGE